MKRERERERAPFTLSLSFHSLPLNAKGADMDELANSNA